MIRVKENTFTSDPLQIRYLELEKILEIISTETQASQNFKIKEFMVRTRPVFSLLHHVTSQ